MKKSLLFIFAISFTFTTVIAQLIAFPGAEGFGKFAKGARASLSPTVYHVTNLNDSGTGSFRDAVSSSNRIVVFDVGGLIKITSRVVVSANIYIAGQTAPGEGITIYGNGFSFSGANNVICRYLRIRMGNIGDSGKDACGISNGSNMIFDHVSVAWGRDETFSISWDGKGTEPSNISIQNSIISQGLMAHSAGGLIQTNGGVTLYRNVYIDNGTRNNKIKGVNQYVNNIVYNWESGAYIMGGDSEGESFANAVSNYFIKGPANAGSPFSVGNSLYHIFAADNWHDANRNQKLDGYLIPQNEFGGGPDFQTSAYAYPLLPTWSASVLIDSVLPKVGASLPYRDLQDYYVIDELKSFGKKGYLITNETENSIGTPSQWLMWSGTKRTDSDNDGMPDVWENSHGLNANLATDAVALATNGYLNIENYINSIDDKYSQDFLRAPLCLKVDSTSQNSISFSWFDFTEKEDGYAIEKKINGIYSEIARTAINVNTFTFSNLQAEEKDSIRVRAFNAFGYSTYSNELFVKTKPIPVAVIDIESYSPDLIWTGTVSSTWDKNTANWFNGSSVTSFSDNSKVLVENTENTTIAINEDVAVNALVVSTNANTSFNGSGSIAGAGSVNKAGNGTLSMQTNNTYTGATVLYDGVLELSKLANGGQASSMGASQNYEFNCVLKGGTLLYTGPTVSTDRNINLDGNATVAVENATTTLTLSGVLSGTGSLNKSGAGKILSKSENSYEGITTISEGVLELNGVAAINNGLGTSNVLKLNGGTFKTTGGSNTVDEVYLMDVFVSEAKVSAFEPYRNCQIKSKVSGSGDLNFNIPYVREYLTGDWSQFSGTLYANGIGTSGDGNQLMLNNSIGIPNARIVTSGNTKILCWKNASTMYLGGLSGPGGTYLSGSDKQNNMATMTWIVGGAGTDETFNGVINNECSNRSYGGTTNIVKDGKGFWKLTGTNVYKGTTTVKAGMLIVDGTHTGTAKLIVLEDAILAGKGNIAGSVEVRAGGIIQAGDPTLVVGNNYGTLSVGSLNLMAGSQINMEVNRNLKIYDKIAASSSVIVGGTLNLIISGNPAVGDQYSLFSAASFGGTFSKIIPEKPGDGMKWVYSAGVLKVVSDVNAVKNTVDNTIKVFPNPVTDIAEVYLDKVYSNVTYTVIDVNCKILIAKQVVNANYFSVDMSGFAKGCYYLRIQNNNDLNKLIKMFKK